LGADRLGKTDIGKAASEGESSKTIKHKFIGGSPLALENENRGTKEMYLRNKSMLETMKGLRRKTKLYEEASFMDESNIKDDNE